MHYKDKRVEDITFNNVSCNMIPLLSNYIHGFDTERIISGVYFNDLIINGSSIGNAADGNFDINDYTENIKFTVSN